MFQRFFFHFFPIISLWELKMGMAAILIYGPCPIIYIYIYIKSPSNTRLLMKLEKIRTRGFRKDVQRCEQMDGQRMGSDHNSSSWAFGSVELKKQVQVYHTVVYFIICVFRLSVQNTPKLLVSVVMAFPWFPTQKCLATVWPTLATWWCRT